MLAPVVAACGKGSIVTKAGSGLNVGFAAMAGVELLPSILLDLKSFFWLLLDSVLCFVGVVNFERGEGLGLLGYLWAGEKGFIMFHLCSMYDSIFFTSDRKGLTNVPHRLHVNDCVTQSFLK